MIPKKPKEHGVSRVALLIIIAVLAILAGFLLPGMMRSHHPDRIATTKMEMANLIAAISQYEAEYGKFPVSDNATNSSDFTFGTFGTSDDAFGITNTSGYQANNSELMAILMDLDKFPDGRDTVNVNHTLNPKKISFFGPGLGSDYVFRDAWGHPYIVTLDLNGDKKCRDAFYQLASVTESASAMGSKAYLVRPTPPPYNSEEARDSFEIPNATVTIWSFGPDGKADKTQKANQGVNQDNITSW